MRSGARNLLELHNLLVMEMNKPVFTKVLSKDFSVIMVQEYWHINPFLPKVRFGILVNRALIC